MPTDRAELPDSSTSDGDPLAAFGPVTRAWFSRSFPGPTEIQRWAWPRIASGEHVLVTAPTGSGKTLTAFLWAIDRLQSGAWPGEGLRVLYLSPLKALNNDIHRNLLVPLAELDAAHEESGSEPQPVRVGVRSGDTPASERRKMLRRPPEILITTPESLNILLTSPRGRKLFGGLETVILDEIHAVAGSKRGTHLITAVDRLTELAGEFQRVALSATVRPASEIARFVGGYRLERTDGEPIYTPRRVACVASETAKRYELKVCRPDGLDPAPSAGVDALPGETPANLWEALTGSFRRAIEGNRSTLLFANSRRKTEKVTRLLNESRKQQGGTELAYSHHGSLSRELRSVVEKRLKEGRLRAIVATNSLELGIDIGALDEVILVQTPPTIASAIQRVGRAGHAVGEVAKARLYPFLGRDYLLAAVTARSILEHDIEAIRPVRAPLDVLAQLVLSMTVDRTWGVDELFDRVRTSTPYRELSRLQFDLVIEMLAGRYSDSRVRELEPRLAFDRLEGTVRARRGVERYLYVAGGTIPDRGYFQLRHHETLARLGELDEEFVWERSIGDTFTLGAQSWRIRKITHGDVLVSPSRKGSAFAPFWRAEERNRSFHLSQLVGLFLERANRTLAGREGAEELARELEERHAMEPAAASALVAFLEHQRSAVGFLPHRRRLLLERLPVDDVRSGRQTWILHTGWGGRVNRPLALILPAACREMYGESLESDADNDSLLLTGSEELSVPELLCRLAGRPIESLLRQSLEKTGLFGARFRENAGRSLLLPRSTIKRRVPLWLQRERGKKLLDTVAGYGDFPIVVETWRSCLEDMFDLEALKSLLGELERGEIQIEEVATAGPSPFAADLMWRTTNRLMYADDSDPDRPTGALRDSLLREVVFSSELRPRFSAELLDEFERKLHRTHPDYAPRDAVELVEWTKERALLPRGEWQELLAAMERDGAEREESSGWLDEVVEAASPKLARATWNEAVVCARERLTHMVGALGMPRALESLEGEPIELPQSVGEAEVEAEQLLAEWLRSYGPAPGALARSTLGLAEAELEAAIDSLVGQGLLVVDRFRRGSDVVELCDAENLERLLRIQRARRRPRLEARPATEIALLLATRQGLATPGCETRDLRRSLDRLIGYRAPARLWESDILPARLDPYYSSWLDSLFQESELLWLGCGKEKVCFAFPEEVGLVLDGPADEEAEATPSLLPSSAGRHRFEEIVRQSGLSFVDATDALWSEVWNGKVSNTTFGALRQGIANRFTLDPGETGDHRGGWLEGGRRGRRPARRGRRERWRAKALYSGDWFPVESVAPWREEDALDREESNKDRVRLLLDRYGIIFRELLARESAACSWSKLFRSLRLMELSGEIVTGQFFEGIAGLQFASHGTVRRLREGLPEDSIYWMSAADPASPAGLGLAELKGTLPSRLPSNHLVFHGARQVVVSRGNGSRLEIAVGPDHPHLERYFAFMKNLLARQVGPVKAIAVTEINGASPVGSSFEPLLRRLFEVVREGEILKLRRRYHPAAAERAG